MKKITTLALCVLLCAAGFAQPRFNGKNIKEVLKAMSPEEKALLVVGWNKGNDNYTAPLPQTAGRTYPFEKYGIPAIVMVDGPMGVRLGTNWPGSDEPHYSTCFPDGLNLAATWNCGLLEDVGRAIGEETLDVGADIILGPGMNLLRNPLNGRNFEYFSEDPFLTGYIAAAYVRGVEGTGAGTSIKHFAANSQETNRLDGDSRMDERTLRELYTRAFEICIRESGPKTVMSSYNLLNGVYTQEDYHLLETILRKDFGFKGLVMTDWTGKRNTPRQLHAGSDLLMGGSLSQTKHILECLDNGSLDMKDLDKAAGRVLALIASCPSFKGHEPSGRPALEEHARTARAAASEGFVMMKNDGCLPLAGAGSAALFGVRSYKLIPGGNGAAYVNGPYVSEIDEALEEAGIRADGVLAGLYKSYIPYGEQDILVNHKVQVHVGKALIPEPGIAPGLIKEAAERNDLAIVTLGRTSGEARDRILDTDFKLQETELDLLRNVCAEFHKAGKKVVAILNICSPVETASWKDLPDAILNIWLPGEEGGHAAADILTGKVNPSGRLPMTFPVDYFDIPGAEDFPYDFRSEKPNESAVHPERRGINPKNVSYTDYTEGIYVGYRHFSTRNKTVSYPFGYGLSYTSFENSEPTVVLKKDRLVAGIKVTNTGKTAGKQALSLFISAPGGGLEKPVFELKSFGKTRVLQPGESETLSFVIPVRDLASFNPAKARWETAKGTYTLHFGTDAAGEFTDAQVTLGKAYNYKVNK